MPVKFEQKSADMVISTAEALKKAAAQLTQVAADMQQHGMKDALLPWTQRQWDCIDVVITLGNQCQVALPPQIVAKQQHRPSKYEVMQAKSQRDLALRKKRDAAEKASARSHKK